MPCVSVVIPTCNRPDLLPRAIRSVLAQTYQDFEVIIVDDGDQVRADEAVAACVDPRIRYIKNDPPRRGGGASRNIGVDAAQGEYVAFLDDDDEWLPGKLAEQVEALSLDGTLVAAFTGVALCETDGQCREKISPIVGKADIFSETLYRPFIWTSAILVRKKDFDAVGGFDPVLPKNQEWDLELRLSPRGPFFGIPRALTRVNVLGDDEHMGGKGNIVNVIRGFEMLIAKHRHAYESDHRAYGRVGFILAGLYRQNGDFANMRRIYTRVARACPTNTVYLRHYLLSLCGRRVYMAIIRNFNGVNPL